MFNYKKVAKLEKKIMLLESLIGDALDTLDLQEYPIYCLQRPSERLKREIENTKTERAEQARIAEIHKIVDQKLEEYKAETE